MEGFAGLFYGILILLGFFLLDGCIGSTYQITEHNTSSQIQRVLNTNKYHVIEHTNSDPFIGDPGDVTFNIMLEETGEIVSCRCTNGIFQPKICRKYQ